MNNLYWHPTHVSQANFLLIAFIACIFYGASELLPVESRQEHFHEKHAATVLSQQAFDAIKAERLRLGHTLNKKTDPLETGLIGTLNSPVTTNAGNWKAKRTSINVNFAAIMVQWLHDAGLRAGDTIAIGLSGSFPALNITTLAAVQTMQLKPLIIASASGSQWGANDPNFLWLDMQRFLRENNLLETVPLTASRGGYGDRAFGLTPDGQQLLDNAIERAGISAILTRTYEESLNERMRWFAIQAAGAPIKAYINVGGGTTSVGTHIGESLFKPGLNLRIEDDRPIIDSVVQRFANEQVPVIHVTQINRLAKEYGLPIEPTVAPKIGDGKTFYRSSYNRIIAGIGIFAIIVTMLACTRRRTALGTDSVSS